MPPVISVRFSVWLIDEFTSSFRLSRRVPRRFSRTRSKMTIVSFVEYPVIVSSAAMTFSERSTRKNTRNASVTRTSCSVATVAPTAKLNWNRNQMYSRMKNSDSAKAVTPLVVRSRPTTGPIISVPTRLNDPRFDALRAASTSRAACPSSVPTPGRPAAPGS